MKKSRIFLASATLALAVSAIFATKANKKFAGITTAFIGSSDANGYIKNGAVGSLLTTVSTSHQRAYLQLCTALGGVKFGSPVELYTTTSNGPVYIH